MLRLKIAWMFGLGLGLGPGCYVGADVSLDGGSSGDDTGEAEAEDEGDSTGDGIEDGIASGPTGLRLLTPAQYRNSVVDVFGGAVDVAAVGQWRSSIAAAQGGVSAALVEDYEQTALAVTGEVFGDPTRRMAVAECTPGSSADDPCVRAVVERLGRRAWRRPLEADELDRYAGVAAAVTELLDDPWQGLAHAVAGLLQSPNFLYRVEVGEPVGPESDQVRLNGYELASRLSYLAWNTTPDDALLDAVESGAMDDPDARREQVQRLLDAEQARDGAVQVFVDMLDLDALHGLQKDPMLLPAFSETIGPAMREELVRTIENTVLDQRDLRRLFDTPTGYVNAELAAFYGIEGEFSSDVFSEVTLPEGRGGLLTLGGFLAINSGEASTSPTNRGLLVRTALMCQSIPPPPPDVEAELPEPEGGEPKTKREQLSEHSENPACAACHDFMDPIGFGLETFDALGGYRLTEHDLPIDPSGELDGEPFADAVELGARLSEKPAVARCMVRNLYRYAVGHVEQPDEAPIIEDVHAALEDSDYDLRVAIEALVTHEAFGRGLRPMEESP